MCIIISNNTAKRQCFAHFKEKFGEVLSNNRPFHSVRRNSKMPRGNCWAPVVQENVSVPINCDVSCQIGASAPVMRLWHADLAAFGRTVKGLHVEQRLRRGVARTVQPLCVVQLKALAALTLNSARPWKGTIGHDSAHPHKEYFLWSRLSGSAYYPSTCLCGIACPAIVGQQSSKHTASILLDLCFLAVACMQIWKAQNYENPDMHAKKSKQDEA